MKRVDGNSSLAFEPRFGGRASSQVAIPDRRILPLDQGQDFRKVFAQCDVKSLFQFPDDSSLQYSRALTEEIPKGLKELAGMVRNSLPLQIALLSQIPVDDLARLSERIESSVKALQESGTRFLLHHSQS